MRVVNLRRESCTIFIGRGRKGPFGNPFKIGIHGTRAEVLMRYETYARTSSILLEAIKKIPEDAVLGCFCKPANCHGDVIMQLWRELHAKTNDGHALSKF